MILIDSSVVIEFTRSGDPALLKQFFIHNGAITGITRAEVLHGARNPKHLEILILALESFKQLEFPSSLWDRVGLNLSKLRKAGISVPFNDVALATLAVDKGLPFWTFDKQFLMIQKALPELTLFDETLEKSTIIPE